MNADKAIKSEFTPPSPKEFVQIIQAGPMTRLFLCTGCTVCRERMETQEKEYRLLWILKPL